MALTDLFTSIANAIRSKDGTTEEIQASAFPQRILDLPSGGGCNFSSGTFTPSSTISTIQIDCGFQPTNYVAVVNNTKQISDIGNDYVSQLYIHTASMTRVSFNRKQWGNSQIEKLADDFAIEFSNNEITFGYDGSTAKFIGGSTYHWIVIELDGV